MIFDINQKQSFKIGSLFLKFKDPQKFIYLPVFFLISFASTAQINFIIEKIPESTPKNSPIYISGSFNNWKPNDPDYKLTYKKDGRLTVSLPSSSVSFEYKFTRGSWETVEGDINGNKIANRTYNPDISPSTIYVGIKSWEDLHPKKIFSISVTKIPENTPHESSIYLAGNFNDWKPNDPDFKLIKQENGSYQVTLNKKIDTVKYKFTRGSWSSVESEASGLPKRNRSFYWKDKTSEEIRTKIDAWEDLPGQTSFLSRFLLLSSAFLGVFLLVSLALSPNKNSKNFNYFVAIILLSTLVLTARGLILNHQVFEWIPKLILFPNLLFFLYFPLIYLYFRDLLQLPSISILYKNLLSIPFILQIIFFIPILLLPSDTFVLQLLDNRFSKLSHTLVAISLVYNVVFFILSCRLLNLKRKNEENRGISSSVNRYIIAILSHSAVCLVLLIAPYIGSLLNFLSYDSYWLTEIAHYFWILFSAVALIHLFFALYSPEVFKRAIETLDKQKPTLADKEIGALKAELKQVMKTKKPYLNPKLTLQDLAELAHTNIHNLSKVINEGYNKNFFDFINDYRIEEFIKLSGNEKFKNYTFLAIALEVGFSSKTTFNRAFKKYTGKTPREYFSLSEVSE